MVIDDEQPKVGLVPKLDLVSNIAIDPFATTERQHQEENLADVDNVKVEGEQLEFNILPAIISTTTTMKKKLLFEDEILE